MEFVYYMLTFPIRVWPGCQRQHPLLRTARARCAAHYGTERAGQANGAYGTRW